MPLADEVRGVAAARLVVGQHGALDGVAIVEQQAVGHRCPVIPDQRRDAGAQRLVVTEAVTGTAVDLGGGNDDLQITASGSFSGSAAGGSGALDALRVDHEARSPALTIGATTFSGFETVNLNEAGTAGTFQLAGDTSVSPDAATGVLFHSETGTSRVLLHEGRMVGSGAIGGVLRVMAGAGGGTVIAPGNSIGRIRVKDYVQTGVYEAEFRVPAAHYTSANNSNSQC